MKFFSDGGDNARWDERDGEAYKREMIQLYDSFMKYCYGKRDCESGMLKEASK